eukprot:2481747-Prymnesium_polylepis.1
MDQTSASGWQGMMEGDRGIDEQFKELCEAAGLRQRTSTDRQLPHAHSGGAGVCAQVPAGRGHGNLW